MKSKEEIWELYTTTLQGRLQELEGQRKDVLQTGLIIVVIMLVVIALSALAGFIPGIFIGLIGGIITAIVVAGKKMKKYKAAFKEGVVTEILKMIDESWQYNSDHHIPLSDYHASNLFTHGVDRHKGDDYVKGTIDKTDFEFSELHTEYKTTTTDSKGNTKTTWHTIFKGLFFHADFNKTLKGKTLVLPDTAERLFGKLGQRLQKMSGRGELVKLENVEFEKEFVVYGTDQIEPRYILTPVMMEKMLDLRKKYRHEMHFSFIGSRVYCAMSVGKDMFEPRVFSSGVRFEDVNEMYDYFGLIEVLINEMNLNTRIWTKE